MKHKTFKSCCFAGGQQVAVRAAPQVFQFPNNLQQTTTTMSVQIPVSQNGQTVLQTVQIPVQVICHNRFFLFFIQHLIQEFFLDK
jgi:hypothetical protein